MLKMSITKIRKSMIKERNLLDWKNIIGTNCYAYALGIDIPEEDICKYAFDLGGISRMVNTGEDIDPNSVGRYRDTYHIDLPNDFHVLGLDYKESNHINLSLNEQEEDPNKYFDILFFLNDDIDDFHFARFDKDRKLYHKRGFIKEPQETTVDFIKSKGYVFEKRYRLYLQK